MNLKENIGKVEAEVRAKQEGFSIELEALQSRLPDELGAVNRLNNRFRNRTSSITKKKEKGGKWK